MGSATEKFLPSWASLVALLVAAGCLLPTSAGAVDTITDMKTLCQDVQCPVDCPSDSVLQLLPGGDAENEGELMLMEEGPAGVGDGGRARRSIATNKHPHESITITAIHHNQLPAQRHARLMWKRDVAEVRALDVCCPLRCACRPCPIQTCPPHYVPIVDARPGQTTGQPGSCCPHVYCERERRCRSENGEPRLTYGEGARWKEGPCVECRCEAGVSRCEASSCKPLGCSKTLVKPDKCCPVCDEEDSIFCPGQADCDLSCLHGFRRKGACSMCACNRRPVNATTAAEPERTTATTPNSFPLLPSTVRSTEASSTTDSTPNAAWDSSAAEAGLERNEQQPDTVLHGTVQHESNDVGQFGNHSTYAPTADHREPHKTLPNLTYFLMNVAFGIVFFIIFLAIAVYGWNVKKRRHGKYSTVPISSSNSTSTASTTASISTV